MVLPLESWAPGCTQQQKIVSISYKRFLLTTLWSMATVYSLQLNILKLTARPDVQSLDKKTDDSLALWYLTGYLTSLNHNCLICVLGITIPVLSPCDNQVRWSLQMFSSLLDKCKFLLHQESMLSWIVIWLNVQGLWVMLKTNLYSHLIDFLFSPICHI